MNTEDILYYVNNITNKQPLKKDIYEKIDKYESFFLNVYFVYKENEWYAYDFDHQYKSLYSLIMFTNHINIFNYIIDHYIIDDIVSQNNFEKLKEIIKLKGGYFHYIDNNFKWNGLHLPIKNNRDVVDHIIDNKIPFRYELYEAQDEDDESFLIYANNIDMVYTLRDHNYVITEQDKININYKALMDKL